MFTSMSNPGKEIPFASREMRRLLRDLIGSKLFVQTERHTHVNGMQPDGSSAVSNSSR